MAEPTRKDPLEVLVIHPERVIFEGKAKAVSSTNERGKFDVLSLHTNFVSIIKEKVVIEQLDGKKKEIPIEEAIMKVHENKIWIFVGIKENAVSLPGEPQPANVNVPQSGQA